MMKLNIYKHYLHPTFDDKIDDDGMVYIDNGDNYDDDNEDENEIDVKSV